MRSFSDSQLEELRARLIPFGNEWTCRTGRQLVTVRDGIDFLAAMKDREDFWAQLASSGNASAFSIDLAAIRCALPSGTLGSDLAVEAYLRSLGLSEDEVREVVLGIEEPDFFDMAIRAAFAEGRPQSIARALERILETNSDVLATQYYVNRFSGLRGVAAAVSSMMGIALLLVGSACTPQASAPVPPPSASLQVPVVPDPIPSPTPAPSPSTSDAPPASSPTPAPLPSSAPSPKPAPVRPTRPQVPTKPVARYKGVSPRKRSESSKKPTKQEHSA
jgi:hypothetical protein